VHAPSDSPVFGSACHGHVNTRFGERVKRG
jgi:hypothetical protein